jgi:hypothetical protein
MGKTHVEVMKMRSRRRYVKSAVVEMVFVSGLEFCGGVGMVESCFDFPRRSTDKLGGARTHMILNPRIIPPHFGVAMKTFELQLDRVKP